jgi:hypothetical protein
MRPPASKHELYDLLERAWWRGEIHGDKKFDRLQLLKHMFKKVRHREDLGIVFIVCGEKAPPAEKGLPDGGVEVDLRLRVHVPSIDTDTWDIENCRVAFDALAQISSFESYPLIVPGLMSIKLTCSEFMRWVKNRSNDTPSFWVAARATLQKPKRGRPPEYNWQGVKARLTTYVAENGPVQTFQELMQKCADFATDLHPERKTPDDATIRAAIKKHELHFPAGFVPGK